jgi:cell division protein FtsL
LIRVVSLFLSLLFFAIGVIYTAYKKREQLSHREKINTPRAKIIATTAPNASVARTF